MEGTVGPACPSPSFASCPGGEQFSWKAEGCLPLIFSSLLLWKVSPLTLGWSTCHVQQGNRQKGHGCDQEQSMGWDGTANLTQSSSHFITSENRTCLKTMRNQGLTEGTLTISLRNGGFWDVLPSPVPQCEYSEELVTSGCLLCSQRRSPYRNPQRSGSRRW